MREKTKRASSSDRIVMDIFRGIYEGDYVPGQRLVEPDMMDRYGVSRSTVRETIKRLAAEGVVEAHAFRGARIRHLTRKEVLDCLEILELLIGLAARRAAENMNEKSHSYFTACFRELDSYREKQDTYDFVRARNRFYQAMTKIAGNGELDRLLPSLNVHLIRARLKMPSEMRFSDYRRMAEAILSCNPVNAEKAARAHVRHTAKDLATLADNFFASDSVATGRSA